MFEHCGLLFVPGVVDQHIFLFPIMMVFSTTMTSTTPTLLPEAEQTVVNPRYKRNLSPDQIKQVLLALLAGHAWDAYNQPILQCRIFSDVGKRFGITQQLPHCIWNIAFAIAWDFGKRAIT
jgi:hypothetical protein